MNRNLLATILIVAAIGIYFTITKSMIADAQAVKAENDQISAALQSADKIIKAREDITQQYNSISPDNRAKLDKLIPSAVDNIRLVIDLNNLALQNHFTLEGLKASVPSSGGSASRAGLPVVPPSASASMPGVSTVNEPVLDKVQVSFSAQTTYEQFLQFLQALEANLRVMDVTHLFVTANEDGTYSFSVQLQTYWLRR